MEVIKEFLYKLGNEYLYWTLIGIIALVIIIFLCIVLHVSKKRARAEKTKAQFKQSSLQSLTPEEIDNISNNSANPEEVKEYLTQEVVTPDDEAVEKPKQTKKTKAKTKKAEVKKEEVKETSNKENSKKSTAKKAEKTQPKKAEKVADTKKAEVKKTEKVEKVAETKKAEKTEKVKETKKAEKPKKATPKKEEPVKEIEKRKYTGKWKISQDGDGYVATLSASNGGTLLKTEKYKSLSGVKNGIETIKKNIDGGNFAISVDKYGHYRFKLFNLSNRLICVSEDYSSKNKCENGIESVKRFAKTDVIIMEEK